MCHGLAVKAFPEAAPSEKFEQAVSGYHFGPGEKKVAIIPDIYGCNPFYFGLSTRLAQAGGEVFLVDPFDGMAELPENTREAAFARRNKVNDKSFLDSFEVFLRDNKIDSVIGFCLGGLYVFELARRNVDVELLGLYGFPQGLPNQDALPVPFNYLESVTQPFTMLLGKEDASVGSDNIERLLKMDPDVPAMTLKVYDKVGHNFLPLLDSENVSERDIALDALSHIDALVE